jgi:large subunit ribosomal protein L20
MVRVKRGNVARKKRKKQRKIAKGFRGSLRTQTRRRKQAILKARKHATRHRKQRKQDFRQLWIARINAAAKQSGMPYSRFIAALKKAQININRKSLAELAFNDPAGFSKLVDSVK